MVNGIIMAKKIKLSEPGSLLGGEIQALEGVKIEGDVEDVTGLRVLI